MKNKIYSIIFSILLLFLTNDVYAVDLPNTTSTCPTALEFEKYDVHNISPGASNDNGKLKYVVDSTGKSYIAEFNSMQGMYVKDVNTNKYYSPDANGNIYVYGITGGTTTHFEFYIADTTSPCVNSMLGYVTNYLSKVSPNPFYGSDVCQNYINTCGSSNDDKEAIPVCFNQYIYGNSSYDYDLVKENIQSVTDSCKFTTNTGKVDTIDLWCEYDATKNQGGPYTYSSTELNLEYCRVDCTETMNVKYDAPIETIAGLGFQYKVYIDTKVECTTRTTKIPTEEVCEDGRCSCNGGRWGNDDDEEGGPNEDFDACIKQCDNGKYSQKCIDSCYLDVYVTKNNNWKNLSYTSKTILTDFDSPVYQKVCDTSGSKYGKCGSYDNNGCWRDDDCDAECSYIEDCYLVYRKTDEYYSDLAECEAREKELEEEGSTSILVDPKHYQAIILNPKKEQNAFSIGSMEVNAIDGSNSVVVDFPNAYIDKITGQVYYDKRNLPKSIENYYDGGNNFYTSVYTPSTNRLLEWPLLLTNKDHTYNSKNVNWNIREQISKIGLWGQWNLNINCFYGLVNKYYCEDDDSCPEDSIEGGIQYIYRTIDLADVFPNDRNPRWNWSCGATSTSDTSYYPITPVSLTEKIEKVNTDIYKEENEDIYLDYHIYLNTETMRYIRDYNDEMESYGNNENYCTKDGNRTVCKSGLLDLLEERSGVILKRNESLIGCNNQIGNQCDYSRDVSDCITYFNKNNYDIVDCKEIEYIEEDQ